MYMYIMCRAMCMTVAGFFFYLGLPAGGKGNETAEEYFQRVMDTMHLYCYPLALETENWSQVQKRYCTSETIRGGERKYL